MSASAYGINDLYAGERYLPDLGLYDDRNRFMSPDLGRFLQPDPIGFKGDASNLYRYCGNDWANRTDPMGLTDFDQILKKQNGQVMDQIKKDMMNAFIKTYGVQRITFRAEHVEPKGSTQKGETTGQGGSGNSGNINKAADPPKVPQAVIEEGMNATDASVKAMNTDSQNTPYGQRSYADKDGNQHYGDLTKGTKIGSLGGRDVFRENYGTLPEGATTRIIGHAHQKGDSSFSPTDGGSGATHPVMKNREVRGSSREPGRDGYDMYFRGWRSYFNQDRTPYGNPFPYQP